MKRYGSCSRNQCHINGGVLRSGEARTKDDRYEPHHVVRCADPHIAAAYDQLYPNGVGVLNWQRDSAAILVRVEEFAAGPRLESQSAALSRAVSAVPPGLGRRPAESAASV